MLRLDCHKQSLPACFLACFWLAAFLYMLEIPDTWIPYTLLYYFSLYTIFILYIKTYIFFYICIKGFINLISRFFVKLQEKNSINFFYSPAVYILTGNIVILCLYSIYHIKIIEKRYFII
jgi:hypothetical protein